MNPVYEIRVEAHPRRMRVEFNGARIAESKRVLVLHETRQAPAYYFPRDDVRLEFIEKTQHRTHCPFKGDASYWTLKVAGAAAENAVWSYEETYDDAAPIGRYLAFYPDRVSAIYDGDEALSQLEHPRRPARRGAVLLVGLGARCLHRFRPLHNFLAEKPVELLK